MRRAVIALLLLAAGPARADDTMPPAPFAWRQLPDARQEARARALMTTIRCLQCQSQSIIDSTAPIAGDLRSQIRLRIARGEDPEAIRRWLISRYGDYVSYAPQIDAMTWPLFMAPLVVLGLVAVVLRRRIKGRIEGRGA